MDGLGFASALLALVAIVERSVTFLRGLALTKAVPGVLWPVIAVVVGIAYCLGFQINLVGQAVVLVPALAESADHFVGPTGEVLTGLAIGALAGPLHELVDALRGVASKPGT